VDIHATATTTDAISGAPLFANVALNTVSVDPLGGATVAGSVITAIAFPASPQLPAAPSAGARFATLGVSFFIDKQPPRTTPNP
jgi:hypothetical protein